MAEDLQDVSHCIPFISSNSNIYIFSFQPALSASARRAITAREAIRNVCVLSPLKFVFFLFANLPLSVSQSHLEQPHVQIVNQTAYIRNLEQLHTDLENALSLKTD